MCIKHGVLEIDNMHTRDIDNHAILFRAYVFGMAVVCDRVPVYIIELVQCISCYILTLHVY